MSIGPIGAASHSDSNASARLDECYLLGGRSRLLEAAASYGDQPGVTADTAFDEERIEAIH